MNTNIARSGDFDKDAIKESQNQVILYITKIKSMNNGVDK